MVPLRNDLTQMSENSRTKLQNLVTHCWLREVGKDTEVEQRQRRGRKSLSIALLCDLSSWPTDGPLCGKLGNKLSVLGFVGDVGVFLRIILFIVQFDRIDF